MLIGEKVCDAETKRISSTLLVLPVRTTAAGDVDVGVAVVCSSEHFPVLGEIMPGIHAVIVVVAVPRRGG